MATVLSIVAIVMGTVTAVTLIPVWLGISYSLKKHGYHPNQAEEKYNQLQSDLRRLSADLEEIRAAYRGLNHYPSQIEAPKTPYGQQENNK